MKNKISFGILLIACNFYSYAMETDPVSPSEITVKLSPLVNTHNRKKNLTKDTQIFSNYTSVSSLSDLSVHHDTNKPAYQILNNPVRLKILVQKSKRPIVYQKPIVYKESNDLVIHRLLGFPSYATSFAIVVVGIRFVSGYYNT